MHEACSQDHLEVAKVLVDNGSDVNALSLYGSTPLLSSVGNSNIELAEFLIQNDANLNVKYDADVQEFKYQLTPLRIAVKINCLEMAISC